MPLTHLICHVDFQTRTVKDCLDCARTWGKRLDPNTGEERHCHLPYPLIEAIAQESHHRVGVNISVTQLTHCWRKAWAETHHNTASYPEKRWAAIHGTAIHDFLDKHVLLDPVDCVAEQRFWKRLDNGIEISGQIDAWWPKMGIITDFKTKDSIEETPWFVKQLLEQYTVQLQIYAWMLTTGCWVVIDGKQRPVKAKVPINRLILYPVDHKQFREIDCPLPDYDAIGNYVHEAAAALAQTSFERVPRKFAQPATHGFCQKVCVFSESCVHAGGTIQRLAP